MLPVFILINVSGETLVPQRANDALLAICCCRLCLTI
jgi:hypothetical protein